MVQEYRWCRSAGGAGVQVVQEYRWCRSTGGAGVQVVQEYRCYMWTELGKRLQEYKVQVLQVVTCGEG